MKLLAKRFISEIISNLHSILSLIIKPKIGIRILMYHSINKSSKRLMDYNDIFTVSLSSFESQLISIVNSNYQVSSLDEIINDPNKNLAKLIITFDDGYHDNLINAAPLLIKYDFPFTIFITTDNIGKPNYLSISDIKELSKYESVEIGSHGATHTPFTDLDNNSLINELVTSKSILEHITNKKISIISYPHGLVNKAVIKEAELAGYKYAFSSRMGINKNLDDKYLLKRTTILSFDKDKQFSQKLMGNWDWYGRLLK
jgi:peptidoglycan/xylan/chitin deacetylase (PgdA/CDA1 family)